MGNLGYPEYIKDFWGRLANIHGAFGGAFPTQANSLKRVLKYQSFKPSQGISQLLGSEFVTV